MTKRIYRKNESAEQKRQQNLQARYNLTPGQYAEMLKNQNNCCKLCGGDMDRPVVDHCHITGRVRGILCHPCNIKLPVVEDMGWVMLAWAYLEGAREICIMF